MKIASQAFGVQGPPGKVLAYLGPLWTHTKIQGHCAEEARPWGDEKRCQRVPLRPASGCCPPSPPAELGSSSPAPGGGGALRPAPLWVQGAVGLGFLGQRLRAQAGSRPGVSQSIPTPPMSLLLSA